MLDSEGVGGVFDSAHQRQWNPITLACKIAFMIILRCVYITV